MKDGMMQVGVVGCGGFCCGNHLPNIHNHPKMHLRALCDLNQESLQELQRQYRPEYISTDYKKIFRDPEIDLVVCATKPDFRLPIMEAAVAAGKPLFVEKPLSCSREETEQMRFLLRSSPIPFMVGFNRPFSPLMQDAARYYRQLRKGETTIVYRIVGEAILWPKSHYEAVMVRRESTIIHEATHIFNLLDWLTGLRPQRVYTAGGGNTNNIITLEYPEDITAVVIAGDNSSAGFPKEYLEINTDYTTIAGYCFCELVVVGKEGECQRHRYPYSVGTQTFTSSRQEMEERLVRFRSSVTQADLDYGYYYDKQVHVDKGHYAELEAFRQCVLNKTHSPIDVELGASANYTAWAAIEAWEKKQAQDIIA